MEERLLTTKEAANYLNIHRETMRRYLENGTIKGYKVGRVWRVKLAALEAYLEQNK